MVNDLMYNKFKERGDFMDGININAILWILSMVLLVVVELSTVGLYCIWFGFGSLAGLVLAMISAPTYLQIIAFAVVSAALFFFVRPKLERKINSKAIKTNSDALIGKTGFAQTDITEQNGGQVKINGQMWSAKLPEGSTETIPKNSKVIIGDIKGVKLIVSAYKTDNE
ncbi:MAG: NfeD family protein [Anaerofustis stercorihominis]|nr:NfeD family protein [Anaerofustis stercorihominis]